MRNKLFALLILAVVGSVLVFSLMGTTYTKTMTRVVVANWGPYLTSTHTFSGTVGSASMSVDTVIFPFTISPVNPPVDTNIAVFILHTKPSAYNASGDSTFVTWQWQMSTDNISWTTAQQIAIDSAVTTTAPLPTASSPYVTSRLFILGPKGFTLPSWSTPYGRIRAIGGNGAGIKNSPANVIGVDWLK